jgi:hypothetical protein
MIQTNDPKFNAILAQLTAEIIRTIEEKALLAGEFAQFKADTQAQIDEFNKRIEALKNGSPTS